MPMEKIMVRVRLDEEALAAMDKSKINTAMDRMMIPRHPQILVREPQIVDLVVAQAIVFRENDIDGIAAHLQFPGQTEHDISQPTHFGHRRAF